MSVPLRTTSSAVPAAFRSRYGSGFDARWPIRARTAGTALLAALLLAACGGSDGTREPPAAQAPTPTPTPAPAPAPAQQAVTVQFAAKAGAADVRCGTPNGIGLGTGGTAAELADLRFYVSDARLITDQEAEVAITLTANDWQNDRLTLIDLEDGTGACAADGTAAMNNVISGTVPPGNYTGIRFTVGVPSALNHSDYAVAAKPMDVQALAWSWQSGRKFVKLEVNPAGGVVRPAPAAPSNTFYVHLGSTGCTGNPVTGETVACARPNRMDYRSKPFNAQTQQVVIDLAGLFAASNLTADGGSAPGCMSGADDPECGAIFSALQIDLASGQPIDQGRGQTLFKVEAK